MNAVLALAVAAVLAMGAAPRADARVAEAVSFHGRAAPISPQLRQRMSGVSWHRG